jgi:hypothetical protein
MYAIQAHTSQRPLKIVENLIACGGPDSSRTVSLIWKTLEERFGSSAKLSDELMARVTSFPIMKSANQTRLLEDFLDLCRILEANINQCRELEQLNLSCGMQKVYCKLPEFMQNRWREKWHDYETATGYPPVFYTFVDFLSRIVEEFNIPGFSTAVSTNYSNPRARTSLRTEAEKQSCIYHGGSTHESKDCTALIRLPYNDVRKLAIEARACFKCLGQHRQADCNNTSKCEKCSQSHVTAMHRDFNKLPFSRPMNDNRRSELRWQRYQDNDANCDAQPDAATPNRGHINLRTAISKTSNNSVCSKTVLVDVKSRDSNKTLRCFCIIDEQSNTSFIDPKVISFFNLNPPVTNYSMKTMQGVKTNVSGHILDGIEVRGVSEKFWIRLPKLFTNSSIPDTRFEVATAGIVASHPHIAKFAPNFINVIENYEVLLLVGSNCGPAMSTKSYGRHYPFVHHTALGFALVGPVCRDNTDSSPLVLRTSISSQTDEHYDAQFSFSNMNVNKFDPTAELPDDEMSGESHNDRKFCKIMDSSVQTNIIGNLTMSLPFKNDIPKFPENKSAVYQRTFNTLSRIKRDPEKLSSCLKVMSKYLAAGHVKRIPDDELQVSDGEAWWLNLFAVTHPKKKKVRLVFDSSASYKDVSLNKCLLQGPDNNNLLLGVLLRFRKGEIGFSGDIENMFHCFYVAPEHRNYQRFFWFDKNSPENRLVEYQALVHIFGNTSSPAVANYGLRYAANHSPVDSDKAKEFIHNNMYVDDGLGSASSVEDAISIIKGAREVLQQYNIRLHKIESSSPEVLSAFPQSEWSEGIKLIHSIESPTCTTLGMEWKTSNDTLNMRNGYTIKPFTKRGILSTNGANFDPLGFAAPVTLGGKLLQRKFMPPKNVNCQMSSYSWDDPLPNCHLEDWHKWTSSLPDIDTLTVRRGYTPVGFGQVDQRILHVFCDASKDSICYVAYLHTLRARHKWKQKTPAGNIGDVVLLNDKSKRNSWPVGVVVDVKKSRDGLVRSVTVKLSNKNNRAVTYERALHDTVLLIPSVNI